MSSKIKLTNNIVKMRKPESSPENSDSENDTESSSDVNVSDDEVEWVTESESESYKPKRSGSGGCGHDNKRRKFVVESDDDDEESESESEDDDDDDDERDCGKNSDDRANKNRPSMSVVKLDDKQKKGINPLISGMIARVKTTAIERQRRNGRKGCVGAQF
jgi:hypothetical protein